MCPPNSAELHFPELAVIYVSVKGVRGRVLRARREPKKAAAVS